MAICKRRGVSFAHRASIAERKKEAARGAAIRSALRTLTECIQFLIVEQFALGTWPPAAGALVVRPGQSLAREWWY